MDIDEKMNLLNSKIKSIKNKEMNQLKILIYKIEDDFKNIINEKDIILEDLKNEINKKYCEIKNYIDDNLNKKELNNLILMNKIVNPNENIKNNINEKIHNIILDLSKKCLIKNTELFEYIENDIYFKDNIDPFIYLIVLI